jgi:stage V sporulation protein AA
MTFHNESQLSIIFSKYNEAFFGGHSRGSFLALNISYSVGLIAGILIFFNHALGKKITDDPTPIEVELTTYKNDVIETVKDVLSEKQEDEK